MNLLNEITTNERKLLENIGINVENKEYTEDELKKIETGIMDFVMSHSIKNNDISKFSIQYNSVLNTIIKGEENEQR